MTKGEVLAIVSHELRTPLTSASSLLQLIADDGLADPASDEVVRALRRNVERLVATVSPGPGRHLKGTPNTPLWQRWRCRPRRRWRWHNWPEARPPTPGRLPEPGPERARRR
ncbi:histidine kinase dimerization/phospho-acceptor domain-containing protein [Saccharothrix xinjiangensis]|uniref:histidine kinase n=1 Tax=Saccharothrix xinjiangensis TaxID=204798 RepID=A0ABV9XVW1_9PSEU